MNVRTKIGLLVLVGLFLLVAFSRLTHLSFPDLSGTFVFDFRKTRKDAKLESIVNAKLREAEGSFAIYIEELTASPSASLADPRKYAFNELEVFPSASLYKLVLLAVVFKEVEQGRIKLDETVSSTKSHLIGVMGEIDYGYEDMPENIAFTVEVALQRVGRISDNFAAIMLTERLARLPKRPGEEGLLIMMTKEIGMKNTNFLAEPITTTALDIGVFFKALYGDQIVSPVVSSQIIKTLELNQLNNRIPALLPKEVKVIHKTGELARLRHDAGIVFPSNSPNTPDSPYIIVLLSKDLKYEDDGIEVLAGISKDVYEYFTKRVEK